MYKTFCQDQDQNQDKTFIFSETKTNSLFLKTKNFYDLKTETFHAASNAAKQNAHAVNHYKDGTNAKFLSVRMITIINL